MTARHMVVALAAVVACSSSEHSSAGPAAVDAGHDADARSRARGDGAPGIGGFGGTSGAGGARSAGDASGPRGAGGAAPADASIDAPRSDAARIRDASDDSSRASLVDAGPPPFPGDPQIVWAYTTDDTSSGNGLVLDSQNVIHVAAERAAPTQRGWYLKFDADGTLLFQEEDPGDGATYPLLLNTITRDSADNLYLAGMAHVGTELRGYIHRRDQGGTWSWTAEDGVTAAQSQYLDATVDGQGRPIVVGHRVLGSEHLIVRRFTTAGAVDLSVEPLELSAAYAVALGSSDGFYVGGTRFLPIPVSPDMTKAGVTLTTAYSSDGTGGFTSEGPSPGGCPNQYPYVAALAVDPSGALWAASVGCQYEIVLQMFDPVTHVNTFSQSISPAGETLTLPHALATTATRVVVGGETGRRAMVRDATLAGAENWFWRDRHPWQSKVHDLALLPGGDVIMTGEWSHVGSSEAHLWVARLRAP